MKSTLTKINYEYFNNVLQIYKTMITDDQIENK